MISLQIYAQAMTEQLSCHMQKLQQPIIQNFDESKIKFP